MGLAGTRWAFRFDSQLERVPSPRLWREVLQLVPLDCSSIGEISVHAYVEALAPNWQRFKLNTLCATLCLGIGSTQLWEHDATPHYVSAFELSSNGSMAQPYRLVCWFVGSDSVP